MSSPARPPATDRFGAGPEVDVTASAPALARRAYSDIRTALVRWFRVPEHPPTLPTAPGEEALSFRPSEAYLRYLKFFFWIALAAVDVALVILWIIATAALVGAGLWFLALPLAPIAIALIVLPDIVAYVGIHVRYDTTWYVLSERSLRVRHGIWIIRELTLTFENVQNVRLVQGPVQRHFGIASVLVETAGGASAVGQQSAVGHHASIDGITNAPEIRDLIMSRVQLSRSAGLGDERLRTLNGATPAEGRAAGREGSAPAMTVRQLGLLRAIRDELRAAATGRSL